MPSDIFIGIDLGTTGARVIAIDEDAVVVGEAKSALSDHGSNHRDPTCWWAATQTALSTVTKNIDAGRVQALCVDGTSGTMLPIDAAGRPLADARMYNDPCEDGAILATISKHAVAESAAHGATSGAAKALAFQNSNPGTAMILHQADWIAGQLSGLYGSDDNNALKTGYDSVQRCWPDWMAQAGINRTLLPFVREPGTALGHILPEIAAEFGLPTPSKVVAGTTDGCAAFLATGALKPGDGVTSIGTTLVLKVISDRPIFDPESGIYSHRLLGNWLAGGASNTGGGVLLEHFTPSEIEHLSTRIDPETPLGLDYYPLRAPGERFPISDPQLPPKLSPRPNDPADFLKAMLEGIAGIEALGYAKLRELGGPRLTSVRTVGGAAQSEPLTAIRARLLGVPIDPPVHVEAAYGSALLAKSGMAGQ